MRNGYENYTPEIPETDNNTQTIVSTPTTSGSPRSSAGPRKRTVRQRPKAENQTTSERNSSEAADQESFLKKIKPWCTANNLHLVLGIICGAIGVYLAISFVGYFATCIKDQAIVNNAPIGHARGISNPGGEGGARLAEFLINECFGLGSFVIIGWFLAISSRRLAGWPRFRPLSFTIKCLLALITVSLIVGLVTLATQSPVNWGGYHGRYVNQAVIDFLGWAGGVVLCVMWIAIFVVVCLRDLIKWIVKKKKERDARLAEIAAQKAEEERLRREMDALRQREEENLRRADALPEEEEPRHNGESNVAFGLDDTEGVTDDEASGSETRLSTYSLPEEYEPEPTFRREESVTDTPSAVATDTPASDEPTSISHEESAQDASDIAVEPSLSTEQPTNDEEPRVGVEAHTQAYEATAEECGSSEGRDTMAETPQGLTSTEAATPQHAEPAQEEDMTSADQKMVVNVGEIAQGGGLRQQAEIVTYPYEFPTLDFMRPGVSKISVDAAEQLENQQKIRKTLLDFGIPIVSIEATVGPTVTLYEIKPDTGVKIARIRNLVDEIALSLAAVGVRIIAPIPGKGTVGIEVPNKDPQTVSMRQVLQSRKFQESKAKLPLALGSTISNEVYVADLAKMPHLLVAGATGQGKSVGLNAIITSLLYSKRPEELKFVMIDPKRVEFSLYAKIESHYLAKIPDAKEPIITDMKKVVATLSSLCIEMENRYDLLKSAQVRNIDEYNAKIKEHTLSALEGHRFMPYIVVIIDEFSDLIMTSGKEVETPIARLAQMARAVGMHVIIATQRPSTNVITGVIKANFPVRVAFRVTSGVDSKTILDTTGAQQLIGRGDMLISMNSEMVRVQCAFIDTPEVEKICQYVLEQPYGKGAYILPEPLAGDDSDTVTEGFGGPTFGDRDPLFTECARYVVMARTASASSLQRRYSIGYNRAGKIMDQMEALGIVGPTTGGKPRDVLIDSTSLEELLSANGF